MGGDKRSPGGSLLSQQRSLYTNKGAKGGSLLNPIIMGLQWGATSAQQEGAYSANKGAKAGSLLNQIIWLQFTMGGDKRSTGGSLLSQQRSLLSQHRSKRGELNQPAKDQQKST
jgi:hypothetical protein